MKIQKSDSKILLVLKKSGIAVLFAGAAILFYACESNNIAEIKAFSSPENLPIQEATNFETTYTDSGEIRYTLKAPKLLRFENDGQSYFEFPEGVHIVEYDANQNITSTLTADYAKQFEKEQRWEAKNNVVVTNARGDSLKTEHLILDEKSERIHTEEFVKIIREDQIITGIGLVSDQSMENWKIKNPKGTIYVSVNNTDNQETELPAEQPGRNEPADLPETDDSNEAVRFK